VKAFLSYSVKDAAFAASLRKEIMRLGVTECYDFQGESPGDRFADHLRKAIKDSDVLILVVPETGASQANTAFFEAGAAKALGKRVFAVMPDSRGRELPISVTDFAILDASKKSMKDVAITLVHALEPA